MEFRHGTNADCKLQDKGAWMIRTSTPDETARTCLQACEKCDRCLFASVSHELSDCSWFTTCAMHDLETDPKGYKTHAMNRTLQLVQPARLVLKHQASSPRKCLLPDPPEDPNVLMRLAKRTNAWKTPILTTTYHAFFAGLRQVSGISLMEIGVFQGASLRMWSRYFPDASIVGVDHFTGVQGTGIRSHVSASRLQQLAKRQSRQVRLVTADQSSRAALKGLRKNLSGTLFDIIIDDGSHRPMDQLSTLAQLFPLVRPGGYYVIEDISSSWNRHYGHLRPGEPIRNGLQRTALGAVLRWLSDGSLSDDGRTYGRYAGFMWATRNEMQYLDRSMSCIHFAVAHDGATALIRKK